jgi:YNFM family putative membrane transporter
MAELHGCSCLTWNFDMPSAPPRISAAIQHSTFLLSLATFSSMATQRICDAMLPELSTIFQTSMAQTAQVIWVFAVVYGVSQLFYGPLGDRTGKFRIITYATLGCSVASLVAALSSSLGTLVLARALTGLCAAAVIPLALAWVGDAAPYERRLEALAKVGLGTTLGIVGGQLAGGWLTDTLGWRWAFALLTVIFAVVGMLLLGDLRRQQRLPGAETPDAPVAHPAFVAQALAIVMAPWSRRVLLIAVVEGAAGFGVLSIIASHLHQQLGLSLSLSGAIVAMFGLGGVLYMTLARWLIRRLGETGLAQFGGALMGLSFAVLGFTRWWPLSAVVSLSAGFGFYMFHNTMQANATQMTPSARGTAVSLFSCALFTGQALGVVLAAHLIAWVGSGSVIALGGATILVLGTVLARSLRARNGSLPSPLAPL